MAHPNEDLVRESFAAYGRGDLDAARKYQTDDIRYHQPGRNPTAGDYEGQEQVIGVMARFGELTNRLTLLNAFDRINLIRPAEGIGIFQSAYTPRRTLYYTLTLRF